MKQRQHIRRMRTRRGIKRVIVNKGVIKRNYGFLGFGKKKVTTTPSSKLDLDPSTPEFDYDPEKTIDLNLSPSNPNSVIVPVNRSEQFTDLLDKEKNVNALKEGLEDSVRSGDISPRAKLITKRGKEIGNVNDFIDI